MKILIADDSSLARAMIADKLKKIAFITDENNIYFAKDGAEAVSKYKEFTPSLVFMDLTMPNVNGFEAIEQIISYDSSAKIVAISADIQQLAIDKIRELGAIGFIKKPVDEIKISKTLQHLGFMDE